MQFQETVWEHYHHQGRSMPWRDEPTMYHVLVSEIMLQQTQVERVRTKYAQFMERFPDFDALAQASLAEVLVAWQGLGYNRRAKFLHEAAKLIASLGEPNTQIELQKLPGIGANTAAAIMNYVYEQPTPFVETNIRTVYFHHFFPNGEVVSDKQVLDLVAQTMDSDHPREWFWALMDYGSWLKKQAGARLVQSKHYKKQSPLAGSVRQLRGELLRFLMPGARSVDELRARYGSDERFERALSGLRDDGLVAITGTLVHLTK